MTVTNHVFRLTPIRENRGELWSLWGGCGGLVLATVPLVLAHPVASEATGVLVVELPVVSSQHCFIIEIESLFGSGTRTVGWSPQFQNVALLTTGHWQRRG